MFSIKARKKESDIVKIGNFNFFFPFYEGAPDFFNLFKTPQQPYPSKFFFFFLQ